MAQSLALGATVISGGFASKLLCMTSSHFCSAERQYRFPLEYGSQRTPSAQWTATAAGAVVLAESGAGPFVRAAIFGHVEDLGVKDVNNMGAAMAPAAASTLTQFFKDTNTKPDDYDLIVTGDLSRVGTDLLYDLMDNEGIDIREKHNDCGLILYDPSQDVDAGGSGCGCSASVLCTKLIPDMIAGKLKKLLFAGTGALLSPVSSMQGESIPGICHLVYIDTERG
jgi:stage V sporulation protein AD